MPEPDPRVDRLRGRWADLVGDGPAATAAGDDLLRRWAEPHRHHHDLRHLEEVLDALGTLTGGAVPRTVALAAWLHDAVYEGRADDEARSAELAAAVLAPLVPELADPELVDPELVEEVVRLVLLTVTHRPAPGDRDGALLCDADLWVLASPPGRYAAYVEGVRREYAHVDDAAFRAGRAAVLRDLLAAPALFTTERGARDWEAPARAQVRAELDALA